MISLNMYIFKLFDVCVYEKQKQKNKTKIK